jgi:hypothetical protein
MTNFSLILSFCLSLRHFMSLNGLEDLRESRKNLAQPVPGREQNRLPPEYEAGMRTSAQADRLILRDVQRLQ